MRPPLATSSSEALDTWGGPPLADLAYEEFAQAEIARLGELRLLTLEERIEADLALGRHASLVPELETLVREHPARERLRAQLMLALYRSGRQADALASYQDARRAFAERLGLEPSRELQALEQAILRQDPAHRRAGPPPALGSRAPAAPRRRPDRAPAARFCSSRPWRPSSPQATRRPTPNARPGTRWP